MKKRKILSLIVAMLMVMSSCLPALAVSYETTSPTATLSQTDIGGVTMVNNATTVELQNIPSDAANLSFKTYQIMYATYDSGTNTMEYHLTEWAKAALTEGSSAPYASEDAAIAAILASEDITSTVTPTPSTTGQSTTEQSTVLNLLAAYIAANSGTVSTWESITLTDPVWTYSTGGTTATATLPVGAYLVVPTSTNMSFINTMVSVNAGSTGASTNTWTISAKNAYLKGTVITIDKQVKESTEADSYYSDNTDAQIGETVTYKLTVLVPQFDANIDNSDITFQIVDTPTNVEIDLSSVRIYAFENNQSTGVLLNDGNTSDYDAEVDASSGVLTIDLSKNYSTLFCNGGNYPYEYVEITYNATVLSTAVSGSTGNENTAGLTYGHTGITSNYAESKSKVYTYQATVLKYESGSNTNKPINSPIGTYIVVERTIEGVAWLDLDMDGKYSDETLGNTDLLLQGIDVYLYSTYKTEDQAGYNADLVEITEQGGVYIVKQTIDGVDYYGYSTTASIYNASTGLYEEVILYPVVDVLGNLVTAQITAGATSSNPGGYSFTQLAATEVVAGTAGVSEEYYVIFKDEGNNYSVVGTNEQPLTFSQLSVTKTTTLAQSTTGLFNRSYASYGNSSSGLTLASISGVEMPSVASIVSAGGGSGGGYVLMTANSAYTYTSLTVEKIWKNMFEEVPEGTTVTFTIKGTSTDGTDTNTYTNIYVFTKEASSTKVECTSATVSSTNTSSSAIPSGSTFTDTNSIIVTGTTGSTTDSDNRTLTVSEGTTDFRDISWALSNVLLTYRDDLGVITYEITNITEVDSNNNPIKGFVTEYSTTYDSNPVTVGTDTYYYYTANATNTQILYELDLYKIGSSENAYLAGAEFTLYTDQDCTLEVTNVSDSATGTSGAVASITVDSDNGKLTIGKLPAGTYYLKETSAPSGYELNQSVWEIVIKYEYDDTNDDWATTPVITVTQIKDKNGEIISGGTPLNVTNSSGTGTTGDVHYTPVSGTVGSATEYTLSYKIQNEINYSMPSAGSIGIGWTSIGGIALMLLAIWMVLREKDKNKSMKQS